ncbi:TauD/TfdA family dioxygenase [Streptosporangium carneum]|uniref:SyrP protein n=1 Tax=Streptosporangium carneum TaxID=47481 RepID=A0A9W6I607_9ACTN|nr:TauD/TfdA family dioxygenase [Streptosporangium carneum]GLK12337.1 syrP protein [Streptosporangium carneum]
MSDLDFALAEGAPPVLRVTTESPRQWVSKHRERLRAAVDEHGAVLVRGLGIRDAAQAAGVSRALAAELLPEREGFAPRDGHGDRVYSSSKWPRDQPMCMHHELSYAMEFPGLMILSCLRAPSSGGVTALADARAVLRDLPGDLVARFEREGWQLLRSYNPLVGVAWTEAFGTTDRAEVERYCSDNHIRFQWTADGGLRTRQRRPAVVTHPVTGERCWFNQIAFLNEWTMEASVREFLKSEFGPDSLPFTTLFGDGEPLDEEIVEQINDVYDRHTLREPWQDGDLMVVDNVRTAHNREPYTGDRQVVVAMGDPIRLDKCDVSRIWEAEL